MSAYLPTAIEPYSSSWKPARAASQVNARSASSTVMLLLRTHQRPMRVPTFEHALHGEPRVACEWLRASGIGVSRWPRTAVQKGTHRIFRDIGRYPSGRVIGL